MISRDETQDLASIADAKKWRKRAIENLEDGLKYADHGAYGQDKERIRNLRSEMQELTKIEKELASEHTRA